MFVYTLSDIVGLIVLALMILVTLVGLAWFYIIEPTIKQFSGRRKNGKGRRS